MALLMDGPPATIEDLAVYDSSVLSVASTEGIDLNAKVSLAQGSLAVDLEGVLDGDPLDGVVVTPALKNFIVYSALEYVYRDAYHSQLNDRYEGRRRQYEGLRKEAWRKLLEIGVGLANEPIARSAAPVVSATPGSGEERTYFVKCTWLNGRGEEGAASEAAEWTGATGGTLIVHAPPQPKNATGWNVYIGPVPEETTRQNTLPLPPGIVWVQERPLTSDGQRPGNGQAATYRMAASKQLWRG
jgi:hypothetical protein